MSLFIIFLLFVVNKYRLCVKQRVSLPGLRIEYSPTSFKEAVRSDTDVRLYHSVELSNVVQLVLLSYTYYLFIQILNISPIVFTLIMNFFNYSQISFL